MYEIQVVIEGIADFLFNRMTDEEMAGFRGGTSAGDKTDEARGKLAEKKVYADGDGLFLPAWTLKRVILDGAHAAGLKLNRKPLRQRLSAVMFVQGTPRFVDVKGKSVKERDYMHEVAGRVPPKKGVMTIVRRPAMKAGWRLRGTLAVLDEGVPDKAVRESLEASGVYVGVGAWRPEFGRFVVREFKTGKAS